MFSSKDSWLSDYDSVVQLGARIGAKIRERDEHESGTLHRNELDTSVERMVADYQKRLQSLKASLHKLSTSRNLSELEYEKRKGMLQELSDKYRQLEKAKSRGWAPSYQAVDVDGWGGGPGVGQRLSPEEVRVQQQAVIAEQDRGLDQLSQALRRQREVGLAINDEVEDQNLLIDDIQHGAEVANTKVRSQTRRIAEVRRKDSCRCTCLLWTIIVVLFILILIVVFVKYDGRPGY
jgi:syntaxin 8